MVVEVPVPVVVTDPGALVNVQVPLDGNPFNTTQPVAVAHVGCVMVPTMGAVGALGAALMTILEELDETHDDALVTV
jgi:hypothetical protein